MKFPLFKEYTLTEVESSSLIDSHPNTIESSIRLNLTSFLNNKMQLKISFWLYTLILCCKTKLFITDHMHRIPSQSVDIIYSFDLSLFMKYFNILNSFWWIIGESLLYIFLFFTEYIYIYVDVPKIFENIIYTWLFRGDIYVSKVLHIPKEHSILWFSNFSLKRKFGQELLKPHIDILLWWIVLEFILIFYLFCNYYQSSL